MMSSPDIELRTSITGPLYRCSVCKEYYSTAYFVKDESQQIYCGDCFDETGVFALVLFDEKRDVKE